MADDLEIGDSRIEFVAFYLLKTLKLKNDKWAKMYGIDDNKLMIVEFFEKAEHSLLVFLLNSSGALTVSNQYPTQLKTKAIYFAKAKGKDAIGKDQNIKEALLYGDLSYSPLEQLSAILDEVYSLFEFSLNKKVN